MPELKSPYASNVRVLALGRDQTTGLNTVKASLDDIVRGAAADPSVARLHHDSSQYISTALNAQESNEREGRPGALIPNQSVAGTATLPLHENTIQ